MLISCGGCGAKIRAPETAAGKRVKCPKCATVIAVPATDAVKADPDAPEPKKTKPGPPSVSQDESPGEDGKTMITSSGSKPPPIKPKRSRSHDKEDDEDDDDERPRRRRMDADEDDYLDVRAPRRGRANSQATTAMTLGIVSLSMSTIGACCCGLFGDIIAIVCGGIAVMLGLSAKRQDRGSTAMTGIICGGIGLSLGILLLILRIFIIGMNLAGGGNLFNFNGGFGGQQF